MQGATALQTPGQIAELFVSELRDATEELRQTVVPKGADFHYNNFFQEFKERVGASLGTVRDLLAAVPGAPVIEQDVYSDPQEVQGWVIGLLDNLLDQVDIDLDQAHESLHESAEQEQEAWRPKGTLLEGMATPAAAQPSQKKRAREIKKQAVKRMVHGDVASAERPRPQLLFSDAPDNSNAPFQPKLSFWKVRADGVGQGRSDGTTHVHPLRGVLENLQYPSWLLQARSPIPPKGPSATPVSYVDTEEGLAALLERLQGVREVAVDLENHSKHSFQGFCCLMQLSTREEDFLLDALALRSHLGPALAPLFADPQVVKVLHGAESDILWLQRDFGIYVAGLFDTGQASRVLQLKSNALAHLLRHYCGVVADKKYQLADWRVRPLPVEMLQYGREDTHYLLFIYDKLREELRMRGDKVPLALEVEIPEGRPGGALGTVLERSRQLCLTTYEKPLLSDTSYLSDIRKCRQPVGPSAEPRYAALYAWRDRVGRERDESVSYVMPRDLMTRLAVSPPTSVSEVVQACNWQGRMAPVVEELAEEVLEVLKRADEQTVAGTAAAVEPLAGVAASAAVTPVAAVDSTEPPAPRPGVEPPTMIEESSPGPEKEEASASEQTKAESGQQERVAAPRGLKRKAVGAFGGVMRRKPVPATPAANIVSRGSSGDATNPGAPVTAGGLSADAASGGTKKLSVEEAAKHAAAIQRSFVAPFTFAPQEQGVSAGETRQAGDSVAPAGSVREAQPGPRPMSGVEVRAALNGSVPAANRFAVLANHDGDAQMLYEGEVARQPKPEAGEEYLPLPLLTRRERGLPDNQRGKRDSARGRGRSDTKRGRGQKSTGWRADRDLFLETMLTSGSEDSGSDSGAENGDGIITLNRPKKRRRSTCGQPGRDVADQAHDAQIQGGKQGQDKQRKGNPKGPRVKADYSKPVLLVPGGTIGEGGAAGVEEWGGGEGEFWEGPDSGEGNGEDGEGGYQALKARLKGLVDAGEARVDNAGRGTNRGNRHDARGLGRGRGQGGRRGAGARGKEKGSLGRRLVLGAANEQIQAGKRSSAFPRSGQRSHTYT